jgi:hypothetical protein
MRLAIVCGGKPQLSSEKALLFIGDSVDKVVSTLEANQWKCIPFKEATNDEEYKKLLADYDIKDISEFLFYYIGHGTGNNIDTFEILFMETNWTFEQIKLRTKDVFLGKLPKSMAIVIDACYSGNAIDKSSRVGDVEVLTATDRDTQTFGKIMPDGKWWSKFSYYFCETFKTPQETDTLNLEQIGRYIAGDEQMGRDTFYLPHPSSKKKKIIIGYTHKINELKRKIKQHYKTIEFSIEKQINRFKYDILRFYPRTKEELYNRIRTSKSMNDLLDVLFDDRKSSYLYCILDFLKIEDNYCHTFQGNKECIEVKTKIKGIIVVVEANTNNDAYKADIYRVLDNEKVEESGSIAETTWENLYKKELVVELEKVLALNCVAKLELQLVLPIKLMKNELKKEDIQIYVIEGMSSKIKWKNKFNITTKFLSRLKGYGSEEDFFFSLWDDNLTRYTQRSEQTIDSNVYCPSDVDSISNFCDNQALFLLSENSLVNDDKFVELYSLGIPFVITSQEDKCDFTSHAKYKIWTKSKVKNIRSSSYVFINEISEELHFLCDDGYSNEFLKLYQKKGKDEPKTENFIGDEDYE